jgi:hypothetical protein
MHYTRIILTRPFEVYVNSFLALLNAPYYLQPNTGTDEFRIRHSVQRLKDSQDDKLQVSRVSGTKHSQDEETRPTRPVQAVMVGSFHLR